MKQIKDFEGLYSITEDGKVYSHIRNRFLKPYLKYAKSKKINYLMFCLSKNGQYHKLALHRILAQAFIPNPNNYQQVDHINVDSLDNRLENLRWCTFTENQINRKKVQRKNVVKSSKYKGIWWESRGSKWVVAAGLKGNRKYLGRFTNEKEAAKVYQDYIKKHYTIYPTFTQK